MSQNVEAIEKYLKTRPEVLNHLRLDSDRKSTNPEYKGKGNPQNFVTSTDISFWIDKNTGDVINFHLFEITETFKYLIT